MPHLNEANRVMFLSKRFHDAVDAVTWKAEHGIDAPLLQNVDENFSCGLSHKTLSIVDRPSSIVRTMDDRRSTNRKQSRYRAGHICCLSLLTIHMPQSALATAGRDAERIAELFIVMAAGALIIWVAVVVLAVYAIRARETYSERAANLLIIGGGVALPTVVLAVLLAYGLPVLPQILTPAREGSLQIDITGKQWWWRVRYERAEGAIETA